MNLSDVKWDDVRTDLYYPMLNTMNPHVLCGECALYRVGLNNRLFSSVQMWTEFKSLAPVLHTLIVDYYYMECVDTNYEVSPVTGYKNILLPSRERALIEMIKYHNYFDEGALIEGLQSYLDIQGDNFNHLYEVGEHFKVSKDTVDYWINEAREDTFTCG